MLRFVMIAGLLFGVFSTQANARTIQYDFDVVESRFSLGTVDEFDGPTWFGNPVRTWKPTDTDYDDVVARVHPISDLIGQTGRVSLQLSGYFIGSVGTAPSVACISGFMCTGSKPGSTEITSTFDLSGFSLHAWDWDQEWGLRLQDPLTGTGIMGFNTDSYSGLFAIHDGKGYVHDQATARFTLANLTITEIAPAPVPLPASASLLAMGLLGFGIGARRRSRAA